MKYITYIVLCLTVPWHLSAQNLQVIPQWISRQVQTDGNFQVVSSVGSITSIADEESGVILTSFLLDVEEMEDTTGIGSLSDKIGLRVYPNPTPDIINLSRTTWDDDLHVTITDGAGKLIRTLTWRNGIMQLQLFLQPLSSSYYLVTVADQAIPAASTFKVLKR